MRRVPTLMARELKSYFLSPLAYVLTAVLMLILNLFFWWYLAQAGANPMAHIGPRMIMSNLIGLAAFLLIFVVPMMTMRLLAGETDSGTAEILVTDPVTDWDIVLGKYLAAVLCGLAMLLPLGIYAGILYFLSRGQPGDWGAILSAFVGLVGLVALYAAAGLFASSLTRNQIISVVIAAVGLLALWVLGMFENALGEFPTLAKLSRSLSSLGRLEPSFKGQIDTRSIFYFLSTVLLLLYLTVRVTESRKWR